MRDRLSGVQLIRATLFPMFLFAVAAVPSKTGFAQQQDITIPPSAEPGQIQRSLTSPSLPRSIFLEPSPDGSGRVPPVETGDLSFVLSAVVVEGSTVYGDGHFAQLYEGFLGREVALASVFEIADRITASYRNDGYVLSRAIVPPQTISEGKVRIRIIEGFVNEVRIEGAEGESQLLDAYAAKIKASRPLSVRDLERYLLLIEDLPGITADATLSPSEEVSGASDLLITVSGKAVDGFVRIDNRGTKFVGPGQLWLGAGYNSLAGSHRRASLRFVAAGKEAKELKNLEINHESQIGTEGKKLHLQYLQTDSEPGHTLRKLEIASKSRAVRVGFTNPLTRSRTRNLSVHANFIMRDTETLIFGSRLSKDRVRVLSFGALFDSADRFGGINQVGVDIDQGLGFLGASEEGSKDISREKARFDFTKARLTLSRLQRLGDRVSLLASFVSQYSLAKLPASEEFGVGGERCGRGYDASEITGDHGACLLLELRYGHNLGPETVRGYQFYGFYDIGGVWRRAPGALRNKANLQSIGAGARFNFTERLSGEVEVAWPLTSHVDSRALNAGPRRGSFVVTSRF